MSLAYSHIYSDTKYKVLELLYTVPYSAQPPVKREYPEPAYFHDPLAPLTMSLSSTCPTASPLKWYLVSTEIPYLCHLYYPSHQIPNEYFVKQN